MLRLQQYNERRRLATASTVTTTLTNFHFILPYLLGMEKNQFWGWVFITFGSIFFLGFVYSAILSKFLPPSTNPIISALQKDWYYCFLVPLTIPVLVVAVYFHWLSMKLFKHA